MLANPISTVGRVERQRYPQCRRRYGGCRLRLDPPYGAGHAVSVP